VDKDTQKVREGCAGESGQGTVEYVLVLLAVTAVAVALITWVRSGSGQSSLTGFFAEVIGWVSQTARSVGG
jgi:hypothetical protein